MLFLTLPSCFDIRNDFGITAKTSNNFTKDDAEKYNYAFDASKITYKDKNGTDVLLTEDEKNTIVSNVNQCLIDAGYSYNDSKTKNISLTLDFTENETKNADILYDREMINRYKGKYDFGFEPYVGPKNKTFIILQSMAGDILERTLHNTYVESFIHRSGQDKVWFIGLPHYSKLGGIVSTRLGGWGTFPRDFIDSNCTKRYRLACISGKADLSNFYAKLTGSENNMTKFDINLHYKENILTTKNDIQDIKHIREHIIKHLTKYICLFIGDNIDDIQILSIGQTSYFSIFNEKHINNQYIKNHLNNSYINFYTIKDNITQKPLNNISTYFSCIDCRYRATRFHKKQMDYYNIFFDNISDLYGDVFNEKFLYKITSSGRYGHFHKYYYLQFYYLKYPISQLEIKNNYSNCDINTFQY